jgi:hypothetical protein
MSNGPWTDEENDLIVADYFAMQWIGFVFRRGEAAYSNGRDNVLVYIGNKYLRIDGLYSRRRNPDEEEFFECTMSVGMRWERPDSETLSIEELVEVAPILEAYLPKTSGCKAKITRIGF